MRHLSHWCSYLCQIRPDCPQSGDSIFQHNQSYRCPYLQNIVADDLFLHRVWGWQTGPVPLRDTKDGLSLEGPRPHSFIYFSYSWVWVEYEKCILLSCSSITYSSDQRKYINQREKITVVCSEISREFNVHAEFGGSLWERMWQHAWICYLLPRSKQRTYNFWAVHSGIKILPVQF